VSENDLPSQLPSREGSPARDSARGGSWPKTTKRRADELAALRLGLDIGMTAVRPQPRCMARGAAASDVSR